MAVQEKTNKGLKELMLKLPTIAIMEPLAYHLNIQCNDVFPSIFCIVQKFGQQANEVCY